MSDITHLVGTIVLMLQPIYVTTRSHRRTSRVTVRRLLERRLDLYL